MRLVLGALGRAFVLFFFLVPAALAQAAPGDADKTAIVGIIQKQLDALQADRAAEAFGYASSTIQHMFGTPDNFLAMVQRGYPAVYRPKSVDFRDLTTIEGRIVQKVLFVGPDGVPVIADYFMEQQPEGSWRINGCQMETGPDQSA